MRGLPCLFGIAVLLSVRTLDVVWETAFLVGREVVPLAIDVDDWLQRSFLRLGTVSRLMARFATVVA